MSVECGRSELIRPLSHGRTLYVRRRLLAGTGKFDEDVVEAGLFEAKFGEADASLIGEYLTEDRAHPLVGHVERDSAA